MLSGLPNRHFDLVLINSDCQTIKQSDILNYFFFSQKAKSLKAKKEEGNTAFKAGNLDEAYKLYRLDDQLNWSEISNEDIF